MSNPLYKLGWSIRHRGVGRTLSTAAHWLGRQIGPARPATVHSFDRMYGTDTGGLIAGCNLTSGQPSDKHITAYAAVAPSRLRATIARWVASDPSYALADYSFIDIGCGKGRALLVASELGFREVIGVEINPSLAAIARENVAQWIAAGRVRCMFRVEQLDALELQFPLGPCLIFLYNPFDGDLMLRLTQRMVEAFRNRPSELEVIYMKPEQAHVFAHDFKKVWGEATTISRQDWDEDPVADPRDETYAYRLIGDKVDGTV